MIRCVANASKWTPLVCCLSPMFLKQQASVGSGGGQVQAGMKYGANASSKASQLDGEAERAAHSP